MKPKFRRIFQRNIRDSCIAATGIADVDLDQVFVDVDGDGIDEIVWAGFGCITGAGCITSKWLYAPGFEEEFYIQEGDCFPEVDCSSFNKRSPNLQEEKYKAIKNYLENKDFDDPRTWG